MKYATMLDDAIVAAVQIVRRIIPIENEFEMANAMQPLMAAMTKFGIMHT